jgi:hypothetical protein
MEANYSKAMTIGDLRNVVRQIHVDHLESVPKVNKLDNPLKIVIRDEMGRVLTVTNICHIQFEDDNDENTLTFIEDGYCDGENSFSFTFGHNELKTGD